MPEPEQVLGGGPGTPRSSILMLGEPSTTPWSTYTSGSRRRRSHPSACDSGRQE